MEELEEEHDDDIDAPPPPPRDAAADADDNGARSPPRNAAAAAADDGSARSHCAAPPPPPPPQCYCETFRELSRVAVGGAISSLALLPPATAPLPLSRGAAASRAPRRRIVAVGLEVHYIILHYITVNYIVLHCIALHCIALHYVALHCIALHTLHYISLHYLPRVRRSRTRGEATVLASSSSSSCVLRRRPRDGGARITPSPPRGGCDHRRRASGWSAVARRSVALDAALRPLLETATTAARPLHHRDDGGAPLFLRPAAAVLRAAPTFAM